MLDIKFIRENPDAVKQAAKNKNINVDIDRILELDKKRRDTLQIVEKMKSEKNRASYKIGEMEGDEGEKKELMEEMRGVKEEIDDLEDTLIGVENELNGLLKLVPNIPFPEVPIGKDESANVVLREVGGKPKFDFTPKDYMEIAEARDWIDVKRAGKVSGTRFGYIKGDLALLEFDIIRYALDVLIKQGFIPVLPPVLIKPEYMDAMGFLHGPSADDAYYLEKDDLYLVGTSEQSIGPMHAGEVFKEEDLPKRYVGFSTCFRREAGSYGKDTKGILRVHQFDKIEMISFTTPEKSREEHKFLLAINETMMQELGLPYRVVHICTGDMGLAKADMYDIETWIPSEGRYRETHSASNITDFQARRLNIKYKKLVVGRRKPETMFVHMLNDTCFAIGRTLIAIIENFQTKDGDVEVPKVLQSYMGKKELK